MKTLAVIGSNYGDEGKGLVTDYLSSQASTLVVRFNGGAQAGHTVVSPDGRRHVFHSYGSGTLAGAATYLSRFFIVNPISFREESEQLALIKAEPQRPWIDPRCLVSTPWDMMLNQGLEEYRGRSRHGSCGLGVYETWLRGPLLIYQDLINLNKMKNSFQIIRSRLEERARNVGLEIAEFNPSWRDPRVEDRFIQDCGFLLDNTRPGYILDLARKGFDQMLFEGAQGLALDKGNTTDFPYLTPSHTGIMHISDLMNEAGLHRVDTHYVTRPYFTRHGAGPLPYETHGKLYPDVVDETNIPNAFQGKMRYAYHEPDAMMRRVRADIGLGRALKIDVWPRIALTCVDHVIDSGLRFIKDSQVVESDIGAFAIGLQNQVSSVFRPLTSMGPTRNNVREDAI